MSATLAPPALLVRQKSRPLAFRLSRYYSIASLVGIASVVIMLTLFYRQLAVDDLMQNELRNNAIATRALAAATWPQIEGFVERSTLIPPGQLAAQPEVAQFRRSVLEKMKGLTMVKVKLYNTKGMTVFSTDAKQIGEDKSANTGVRSALQGRVSGDITFRDRFDAFEGSISNRNLVYTYVPVFADDGLDVQGAFEVYTDVTELVERLDKTQWRIVVGVSASLGLLYLFLFLIVRRADGIILGHEHERLENERRITHQAYHDALTGLPNRANFGERIDEAVKLSRRSGRAIGLMFIDLDRFKWVNDSLGHDAGDQLLRIIAQRLSACLRESDMLFRMGGDEFTVILNSLAHNEDAAYVARKIIAATAEPVQLFEHTVIVSASIGISIFPVDAEDAPKLVKNADAAMYLAKESGRNRFEFYNTSMGREARIRLDTEIGLRRAVHNEEFCLHYQARFSSTGDMTGVEALLRWNHPESGLQLPKQFLGVLEDTGLIVAVGEWVLRNACAQARAWHDEGRTTLRVAVNISPRQFRQEGFIATVRAALTAARLAPRFLELDLTEGLLVGHSGKSIAMLGELKALGVKLTIDDFGAGYSSLSYLRQYPVDFLKLDPAFLKGVSPHSRESAIVGAVSNLASSLGMGLVAEGVEDAGQAMYLRSHFGCEMQGKFLSEPVSATQFAERYVRIHAAAPSGAIDSLDLSAVGA